MALAITKPMSIEPEKMEEVEITPEYVREVLRTGIQSPANFEFVRGFLRAYYEALIERQQPGYYKKYRINQLIDVKIWFNAHDCVFNYRITKKVKVTDGKRALIYNINIHEKLDPKTIHDKITQWLLTDLSSLHTTAPNI